MDRTYQVAATPAEVWDAVATADGLSAWLVPTLLDPRVGGELAFDHGDFPLIGIVTGSDREDEVFSEMVAGWAAMPDNVVAHLERGAAGGPTP